MSAAEWLTVISAITAAIVSCINAWRTPRLVQSVKEDVAVVHQVVNSRMDEFKSAIERQARSDVAMVLAQKKPPTGG